MIQLLRISVAEPKFVCSQTCPLLRRAERGVFALRQRGSVERKIPRVSSFPRVASAENLPSKKRLADGEPPPLVNGHRRKRTPQASDV